MSEAGYQELITEVAKIVAVNDGSDPTETFKCGDCDEEHPISEHYETMTRMVIDALHGKGYCIVKQQ